MERRLSSGQPLSAQHAVSLAFYICVNCWLLAHESCNSSQAETKKCWARNGQIWNKIAILGEIHCWVSWLMGRVLSAPLSPSQQPNVFFQSTKIILGPSDTWSMRWSTQRPNILNWRLLELFLSQFQKNHMSLEPTANNWHRCKAPLSTALLSRNVLFFITSSNPQKIDPETIYV